jgi:hypothetical protein
MATQVQFRGGTTTEHASFNGAAREVTVDTTKQTVVVQDGSTNGGFPLLGEKNADNVKVHFGTGNDLEIYHDGTNSFVDNSTGNLYLRSGGNSISIRAKDDEQSVLCNANAAVELYYDGSKKFETWSGGVTVTGNLNLNDNDKLALGSSGSDLEIWHDGTGSQINNSTSYLVIQSDDLRLRDKASGHPYLKAVADGAVELYHNNVKRLETSATGVTIPNTLTVSDGANLDGDIKFKGSGNGDDFFWDKSADQLNLTDNRKIRFGDSGDLEIYHDGSNSYINEAGGGGLLIKTNDFNLQNAAGTETMIWGDDDAGVFLYYNGAKKFETWSGGVTVTGNLNLNDSDKLALGSSGSDLEIYHDGSNSWIKNSTNTLILASDLLELKNGAGNETYLKGTNNGAVELYYDNDPKAWAYASGLQVKTATRIQGITNGDATLLLYADDAGQAADYWKLASEHTGNGFTIASYASGAWQTVFKGTDSRTAELHCQGSKKLNTYSAGVVTTGLFHGFTNEADAQYGTNYLFHKFQQDANNWTLCAENSNDTQPYGILIKFSDTAPDNNTEQAIAFADNAATRFTVYSDGDVNTSDAGTLTSDETLKENITDATSKLEDLKKLKVRNYNWKASFHPEKSKTKQIGFIAQEVEEVFPGLVKEYDISPDVGNEDHTPIMKKAIKAAWDPIIIKAMQELITKVETLETKVAALEAG